MMPDRYMLASVRPPHHCLLVGAATGLRLISLTVMQSLNAVFDVSLNKLLNKPSYDVTVMGDFGIKGRIIA